MKLNKYTLPILGCLALLTTISYFLGVFNNQPELLTTTLRDSTEKVEHEEKNKLLNARERAQQEFEKTKDPATGTVPKERLLAVKKEIQRQNNARGPIPNITWTERGPSNVGGRTRAILFDRSVAANTKVWAGGITGGLWKTENFKDANPTWTLIDDFFQNIAVSAIVQDPNNPMIIYFGTGEGFDGANRGLGIWKTTNGGTSWSQLTNTNNIQFHFVQDLLIDKNGHLYASTGGATTGNSGGIKKSTNGGVSWTNVLGTIGADLELGQDGSVYASLGFQGTGVDGSVHVSDFGTNGANTGNAGTWNNITPTGHGIFERVEIAVAPSDADRIYLLCEGQDSDNVTKMFRSENGGNNWTSLTVPTICDQGENNPFTRKQAWYDLIAVVNPNDPDFIYIGGIDALKSGNKGVTWTQITDWAGNAAAPSNQNGCALPNQPQNVHADHHMYVFEPGSGDKMVMGTDGGIYYTEDINKNPLPTFVTKNSGYRITQFYSAALHPTAGSHSMLGGTQDNGCQQFSQVGLDTTRNLPTGDGGYCHIDQGDSKIQIISGTNHNYQISGNSGQTFLDASGPAGGAFINPTDYDNTSQILYANHRVDTFLRWNNPSTSIVNQPDFEKVRITGLDTLDFSHVMVSPNINNRVYFGNKNTIAGYINNANTGTANKAATKIFDGINLGVSGVISCISIEKGNENHIIITLSNYGVKSVWETTNGGANWTDIEGNLPDMPVRWAMINPLNNDQAFLATEMGVWTTDNLNGTSTNWNRPTTSLANVRVDMLQYRASDRLMVAATHGRGFFTTILPSGPCVATLNISNNPIASGTYQASNTITSNGTVPAGNNVTFDAKNSVTLNNNFTAATGSTFLAKIGGCVAALVDEEEFVETSKFIETVPEVEPQKELEFSLYPSPATSEVTIDFFLEQPSEAVITLHSSTGNVVKMIQNNTNLDSGNQRINFNASDLQGGMYYVVISTPTTRKSQKLMVQRN